MNAEIPRGLHDAVAFNRPGATADVSFTDDATAWGRMIAAAPFPHLPQSFAYGEAKRATGWSVQRAVFSVDGRIVAFATVLIRRVLGVRFVARVNRGPVFLDSAPSARDRVLVYSALRNRWRGPLLIAPALAFGPESDAILREAGFVRRQLNGWRSGRIDLSRSEGAIWKGFASTFRNRVRGAERSGSAFIARADEDAYQWLIARHLENMQDKDFKGPTPAMLRRLRSADPQAVTVFQMVRDGRPIAGMSVVRFGRHAEYHIGWFGPEGRKVNAGNFLMWNIMKTLKAAGTDAYDVGGMRPGDGYSRFKATMNPVEFELDGEWMSF